jgi:transposase
MIQNNPNLPWIWNSLSSNPNITWQIVENNPHIAWNWGLLKYVIDDVDKMIETVPQTFWNFKCLSLNPNIQWETVKKHSTQQWRWYDLGERNIIPSFDCVTKTPLLTDLEYYWCIALWPGLTWSISKDKQFHGEEYVLYYFWKYLGENKFQKSPYYRKKLLSKKYYHIWLSKTRAILKQRSKNKIIYDCCMHEFLLRFRNPNKQ